MSKVNSKTKPKQNNRLLFISISFMAIFISLIYSIKLRWLGDDIFIGFRYIQNFLDGHGLVYNVGERVEGYTDFLWIMLISFFTWLKVDPLFSVQALGILSSIGTLILFSIITYKLTNQSKNFIVPFISLSLALNYDYNVWATSGLETSFFCFLLSTAFYIYFFSSLSEKRKKIFAGLFLCLALLTRPETILIITLANMLILAQQIKSRIKISKIISDILLFNLCIILIYIPYYIWRYRYYGFPFPNTYYDKLGYESMFSKGFYYLWLYFGAHFVSFLILFLPPFILIPFLKKKFNTINNVRELENWNSAFITSVLFVFVYLIGFVAKVGGDFMQARFIIPVSPFIGFIIYYSLLKIVNEKKLNLILVILLCLSFFETKIRFQFFKGYDENGNKLIAINGDVADERDFYINYVPIDIQIKFGKTIHRAFEGIDAKILIEGGQACFGYFANFNYCQEKHGLTDTLIAHSAVKDRGRIGHEKKGTLEYFQNKGINFVFFSAENPLDSFSAATIFLPPYEVKMTIISYNIDIMNKIKERYGADFHFTDFPAYLDDYIKNDLPIKSHESLKKDYDKFNLYYFKHNNDIERENQFSNTLNRISKK